MKLFKALVVVLAFLPSLAWAGSTVNPSVPAQGSNLSSAVVRNNFAATYNDINNILGKFANTTAPGTPTPLQDWVDTSGGSTYAFKLWDQVTQSWVTWANLNVVSGVFSVVLSSGNFAATPPLTVSIAGSTATYGINYDSNFRVNSNALALNVMGAGTVLANCTGATAEPAPCSWNSFANQAISSVGGSFPINVAGTWGIAAFSNSFAVAANQVNLQPAAASTLGGVNSFTCASHQWANVLSTLGVFSCGQPGFGDLSGTASLAQGGLGGSQSAATANQVPVYPGGGGAAVPTSFSGNVAFGTAINIAPSLNHSAIGGF